VKSRHAYLPILAGIVLSAAGLAAITWLPSIHAAAPEIANPRLAAAGVFWLWRTGRLQTFFGQVVAGGEAAKKKLAEVLPADLAAKAVAAVKAAHNESQDTATQKAVDKAKNGG